MDDAHYFLVKNFINNTTFFEWDPATYNSYFKKIKDAHDVTIPKLNEMACEQVELASVPYVSFVANKAADGQAGGLFVRAARLCAALARQRVGRVRPREADRHGGDRAAAQGRRSAAGLSADRARHATADAGLHRHLVAAARRQDADRARAGRIFLRPEPAGVGLRRQSRRVQAARPSAGLHRGRQHPRHARRDGAVRPARRRTTACRRWSTSAMRCSSGSSR